MYPVLRDERGSFQELVHSRDVSFGQLSVLTINPGKTRGGHYHIHKEEWFCCLHGECQLEIIYPEPDCYREVATLSGLHREFYHLKPQVGHTITNPGPEVCELLVIASEVFDPANPDTFLLGEKREQT